jgi:hypothetical protein
MKRLIDRAGNDFSRAVLRSAENDVPSKRARERTAAAVGVAIVAASATASGGASTAAAAASTTAKAAGAATASATGIASVPFVKAISVLVAAGALATGAVVLRGPKTPPVAPPTAASVPAQSAPNPLPAPRWPSSSHPAPRASAGEGSTAEATPQIQTTGRDAPSPRLGGAASVAVNSPPLAPPAPSAPGLTRGMSHLEAARAALAAGDPATALAHVSDYDRDFPNGELSPEASVLRIEALAAMGANADAIAAADRFLAATPNSPHARHVRAIVAPLRDRAAGEANPTPRQNP